MMKKIETKTSADPSMRDLHKMVRTEIVRRNKRKPATKIAMPKTGAWTFRSADVADHFDAHVHEQLPWYDLVSKGIVHFATHYVPKFGCVVDLGASTGNVARILRDLLNERDAAIINVESSVEMAENLIRRTTNASRATTFCEDAVGWLDRREANSVDLLVMNLFLMFVAPHQRAGLLVDAARVLRPGGAMIVVDRTEARAGYPATVLWRLALAGKLGGGATPEEIVGKELALAGVQRPLRPGDVPPGAVEWFRFGDFAGWLIER